MVSLTREPRDEFVDQILRSLEEYETQFPQAHASLFRQNPGAIRIRIIDNRFAGMPKSRRHDDVWSFLQQRLNEDTMSEITELLLLPTAELRTSLTNLDYEEELPKP